MATSLLLHLPLLAQITVTPGDPAALQTAIDGAPAGAVILVEGGTWNPITIDKPLELIAEPQASLRVLQDCPNNTSLSLVSIEGSGSGRVTLQNFSAVGSLDGGIFCGDPSPLVTASGLDELWILNCDLRASWIFLTGSAPGAPGIESSVPYLIVAGSRVEAIPADTDSFAGFDQPPGILAPNSDVLITQSSVAGGSYSFVTSCPGPPFPEGVILPAPAVAARRLFQVDSELTVDNTTDWFCFPGLDGTVEFNEPAVEAPLQTTLLANLTSTTDPVRGATWDLDAELLGGGGVLFINSDTDSINYTPGLGWSFLSIGETFLIEVLGPGLTARSFAVPANPALVGFELAAALYDLDLALFGGPVIAQIR